MVKENNFPGNNPAEAWKIYKAQRLNVQPTQVFEYITDCLTGMTAESPTLERKNLWGLCQLTISLTGNSDQFNSKSWEHVAGLARSLREGYQEKKPHTEIYLLFISTAARLAATGAPKREI